MAIRLLPLRASLTRGAEPLTGIQCVLFDLDGTLLNTNDLIIKSFQHTLSKHLSLEVTEQDLYPYFGEPLRVTLERFGPELAEEMLRSYREFNNIHHDQLTTIFPGAVETLEELSRRGVRLGVVTSKITQTAIRGLELFGIRKYFDVVVGLEMTDKHKPDPEPILKALEILDLPPSAALMVGDSPFDILCARNAGVKSAAVAWSVHSKEKLMEERPDCYVESFGDVVRICSGEARSTKHG